ncbi:MAG: FtsX-like permease family protein [Ktedonobacterales bacterium]
MDTMFTFSGQGLLKPLALAALAAFALLAIFGLHTPHLLRIGLRNVPRRPLRTALIVFGLMLSTSFVASSLAVDDTITQAVRTIAVFNLGRIDEDVTSSSRMGMYPAFYGRAVAHSLAHDSRVAGVAPTLLVDNLLVADATSRQVRGSVAGLALDTTSAGPLGDLQAGGGQHVSPATLAPDEVYLNGSTAGLLNAHPGDTVYLYSSHWPGQRYRFRLRAVVSGGPLGDAPTVVLPLTVLQGLVGEPDQINHTYVANAGDGLTGVRYSDAIAERMNAVVRGGLDVHTVKEDGVNLAVRAQDIFGRILTLYTLFALAIGLLLIFLIFVLLAAERRAELGMVRAIGLRRGHVVRMLLFEGGAYDVIAATVGILAGLSLGILIVKLVSPTLERIGFPLRIEVQPGSMFVAFGLGLVFTLATIWLAAWSVSRITVAAALRDLPEPPSERPTLWHLTTGAFAALSRLPFAPGVTLVAWGRLLWALIGCGVVPLLVGSYLIQQAIQTSDALLFSAALSCLIAGGVLLLRWLALAAFTTAVRLRYRGDAGGAVWVVARATLLADRLATALIGAGLALYWSLPFDALEGVGLPRFSGGIQVFFVAGVMMVFGTVWALAPNLDVLLAPLRWATARLGRLRHVTRIALVYPAYHRFRTGIGLTMFSLVCFTMVVMACIAASVTSSYDNLPAQTAGYDFAGQPLFSPVGNLATVTSTLRRTQGGGATDDLSAVSSATPLPLGILQPGAPNARWSLYPASQVDGSFLDGVGLPLVARASGYADDAAVWRAVRTQPGSVVIDAAALNGPDATALGLKSLPQFDDSQFLGPPIAANMPGLSGLEALNGESLTRELEFGKYPVLSALISSPYSLREMGLRLRDVVTGPGTIAPTPLWVADLRGGKAMRVNVVGVVQNMHGRVFGLLGSPATFAPVEQGLPAFGNDYYYFKVRPGVDPHAAALTVGSALLDYGFETTVLQDVLLDTNGPRVFISRILVGLVGLALLVGMAALAVTGSRAVVERRQQIGMLRALGFHRLHVQALFLLESLLVGAAGTSIGLLLGLLLCRNIFAVDFFAPVQSGLILVVPWGELGVICGCALVASAIAAILPAWQAGHVAPADALRYE